jgi:hypothetical protein
MVAYLRPGETVLPKRVQAQLWAALQTRDETDD